MVLDCGELDPLAYLNHASNKASASSSSVAWRAGGGNCLGIKLKAAPAVKMVSVWRVEHVPFEWNETDFFGVLQDAGWSELQALAYPTRKVRPWLLRAKAPANVEGSVAGIKVGVKLLTVEKAGARAPAQPESKTLLGCSSSTRSNSPESS